MTRFNQVSGGDTKLIMYQETSFQQPEVASAILLDFASETFSDGVNKQQSAIMKAKRGKTKPFTGFKNLSGGMQLASYTPAMGYILKAMCGAASTTEVAATAVLAGEVVDKGNGFVGFSVASHNFIPSSTVSLVGSANYDGYYRVELGTTLNEIIINAPYKAETIAENTVKICRGRAAILVSVAAASNSVANDSVIFTTKDYHGLQVGDTIEFEKSTSYTGTATITAIPSGKSFSLKKNYLPEDLATVKAVAIPKFYTHKFALPKTQPTVTFEKIMGFDVGAAKYPGRRFLGCKLSGYNFNVGGDSELLFDVAVVPASAQAIAEALNAKPKELAGVVLSNLESSLWLDGVRRADVETCNITSNLSIEQRSAIGDMGNYTRLPEGDPEITASMSVFLEDDAMQNLADSNATVDFKLALCGDAGDEFWYHLPAVELGTEGSKVSGSGGIMQDFTVTGFVDNQTPTVLEFTLINRLASY